MGMTKAELARQTISGGCLQARAKCECRVQLRGTCLLFLFLCLGSKHLVKSRSSEPSSGIEKQDVLLEAKRHTGCNAQAHLERQGGQTALPAPSASHA